MAKPTDLRAPQSARESTPPGRSGEARPRSELERLFDLSLDLLCVAGVDGYFKEINPSFERLLGYSRKEMLSRRFVEFIHPEDRERTEAEVLRLAQGLPTVDFQNRYRAKSGEWRWLAWRAAPSRDGTRIYAVARDITTQKRMQELLQREREELARSNSDLEQFASAASHDLRAPLRQIGLLAEWLDEELPPDLPESAKEHLEKLRLQVTRMEKLIEDLLAYARSGRRAEEIEPIDTGYLVSEITELISPPAGFSVIAEPGLPVFDTVKSPFEQVLRNLIANAIEHHDRDHGTVRISAGEVGEFYEFTVADDGPGIPEKYRSRIFKMFHKLELREPRDGTGMGLALVRRIVELQGGRIWVEPVEGRGATFCFSWPKRIEIPEERHGEDTDRR